MVVRVSNYKQLKHDNPVRINSNCLIFKPGASWIEVHLLHQSIGRRDYRGGISNYYTNLR